MTTLELARYIDLDQLRSLLSIPGDMIQSLTVEWDEPLAAFKVQLESSLLCETAHCLVAVTDELLASPQLVRYVAEMVADEFNWLIAGERDRCEDCRKRMGLPKLELAAAAAHE